MLGKGIGWGDNRCKFPLQEIGKFSQAIGCVFAEVILGEKYVGKFGLNFSGGGHLHSIMFFAK